MCFATCFFRVFEQTKRLKNFQMFLVQIKNSFVEKNIFSLIFFVSLSVFCPLQGIWFKHVAKRIEFTKPNKKYTQNLKRYHFIKKKFLWRVDKTANIKKENSKTRSEEAIGILKILIDCFQSHECIWNVTSGDYEEQNRKFYLQKNLICHCKNMTSIDMTIKNGITSEANLNIFVKTLHHRLLT